MGGLPIDDFTKCRTFKRGLTVKTFFTLMIFLLATSICHAEINVKVKLKQVRDNGRNWDVFEGNPDPVICITLDSGPRKGASACFASFGNKNKIRGMKTAILRSSRLTSQAPLSTLGVGAGICRNRLECSFKDIQVGDNDFTLYIFDQDPSLSPLAGYIEHEGDRYFYYNMDNVDSLMVTNTEFDKPKGKQFIYTGSKNSKPHPITKNRADISVNDFTEYMLKYSTYGYFAYVDWEEVEKLKRQSGQSTIKCFLSRLFLLGTPSNDIAPYQISESDGIRLLKKMILVAKLKWLTICLNQF